MGHHELRIDVVPDPRRAPPDLTDAALSDHNDAPIKIGYSMSLTGALAANGQSARLAHEIWAEDVNERGGLFGRRVQLVCLDDETDGSKVADIYSRLLDVEQVDLVVGGYGTNTIAPAMPLVIERQRYFVGLMGLGVNSDLRYPNYFAMIPTGPRPNSALTEGFFNLAAAQQPKPTTVAIVAADAEFSRNPIVGARENAQAPGSRSSTNGSIHSRPPTTSRSSPSSRPPEQRSCSSAPTSTTRSKSFRPSPQAATAPRYSAAR